MKLRNNSWMNSFFYSHEYLYCIMELYFLEYSYHNYSRSSIFSSSSQCFSSLQYVIVTCLRPHDHLLTHTHKDSTPIHYLCIQSQHVQFCGEHDFFFSSMRGWFPRSVVWGLLVCLLSEVKALTEMVLSSHKTPVLLFSLEGD